MNGVGFTESLGLGGDTAKGAIKPVGANKDSAIGKKTTYHSNGRPTGAREPITR